MAITKIDVNGKAYTPEAWKALPLTERVTLLKTAKFYDGATEVSSRDAIAQLR
jgi:hypothetical protein